VRYSTIALLLVLSFSAAYSAEPKLDSDCRVSLQNQDVDVIVQFKNVPSDGQHQRVLAHGGKLKHSLDIIRAAHYSVPANQLQSLSEDPDVTFIAPDRAVKATANAVYTGSPDYGWRTAGADLATSVFGLNGSGVGIALIDSGTNK